MDSYIDAKKKRSVTNNNKIIPKHLKKRMQASTHLLPCLPFIIAPSLLMFSPLASGLTITEDFSGVKTSNNWLFPLTGGNTKPNSACLTSGNNSNLGSATVPGSPPACTSPKEAAGKGALRLTPVAGNHAGGIISDFTFPTNEGIEVSFVTYTYGGSGADGIAFILTDGEQAPSIGAMGGSLGYSCANSNAAGKGQGILGGYLGLGIDEHGNFLNEADNTNTGFGFKRGRIGLRGAGSINWATLNTKHKALYPDNATGQNKGIEETCRTGKLQQYKGGGNWASTNQTILNYPALAGGFTVLPTTTPIDNRGATATRANTWPISYKLRITPAGLLSLWWSYNGGTYQPILLDRDIIATNGPLPSSFRFGFSGSTGGSTNNHEITCFKAAPASKSDNSAAISLPDGEYKTDSQIYVSIYNPNNWWSSLVSQNMVYHATTGTITINPQANWDASCVLTGGVCNKTGGNTVAVQTPDNRSIITYDDDPNTKKGIPFRWDKFSSAQKAYLNGTDNDGQLRLQYLRGERDHEFTTSGLGKFRARNSVLGDIINSGPS